METKRNNRAIGDPLPVEPRRGKHRQPKGKNFCNRLKGEHSMVFVGLLEMFSGRLKRYSFSCKACGHKVEIWNPKIPPVTEP